MFIGGLRIKESVGQKYHNTFGCVFQSQDDLS